MPDMTPWFPPACVKGGALLVTPAVSVVAHLVGILSHSVDCRDSNPGQRLTAQSSAPAAERWQCSCLLMRVSQPLMLGVCAPVTPAWGFERDRESVVLSGYVLIQHESFQVERCLPKEKAGACSYRP